MLQEDYKLFISEIKKPLGSYWELNELVCFVDLRLESFCVVELEVNGVILSSEIVILILISNALFGKSDLLFV